MSCENCERLERELLSALAAIEAILKAEDSRGEMLLSVALENARHIDLSLLRDFKKDTERLNWLENEPADVIFTFKKSGGHKFFVTNFNGKQSDKASLREAIDEAMK